MTTLITGTPKGSIVTQEDLYVESSPFIFIQDSTANPLYNPDSDGFYWQMSGTVTYPVYELGCVQDVSLTEGLTMNDVRCDTVGIVDTMQRRDYVEFNFTILSLFPLVVSRHPLNLSIPVSGTDYEKVGIGQINNTRKYMVWAPLIYDAEQGDYVAFHLHKAKFVDAWTIDFKQGGDPWALTNLKLRAYADNTRPTSQRFGVIIRGDASAL
jgi:hypothetical protein